jgi:futalosine hydrolase
MPRELLIITAVDAEARAIGEVDEALVIAGGIGRTNAAVTTTEQIIKYKDRAPFDAVISAGVAGSLPESNLKIGDAVVASSCIYAEEGIITASGFAGIDSLGFAMGDFPGNTVPVDEELLDALADSFAIGPIATVATCSGTDAAAADVTRRTGAIAEAMEGAAVVHAARRFNVPAIELRTISNTTGDRAGQQWDLDAALAALGEAIRRARALL